LLCKEIPRITAAVESQLQVGYSHGKFVVEVEVEVNLWRLSVSLYMCYNYNNLESVIIIRSYGCWIYNKSTHQSKPRVQVTNTRDKFEGRAIAEAVSSWLPTAAARVQSRVWSSGICGGPSGVGAGFLRVLRCHSFHQILHPHNHPGQVQ
jgi:hypothetical protein